MRVLLLSGGTDSTCLAYSLRPDLCITIDYGQVVASRETKASRNVCRALGLTHKSCRVNLRHLGGGIMAGRSQAQPGLPPEWWPYRNQLLITLGSMIAFKRGADELIIGCIRSDRQHVDGSPGFVRSMRSLLRRQEGSLRLQAPAIELSAEELIKQSRIPLEILGLSFSCHRSTYACGCCRGCLKNISAMAFAVAFERKSRRNSSYTISR